MNSLHYANAIFYELKSVEKNQLKDLGNTRQAWPAPLELTNRVYVDPTDLHPTVLV